MLRRCRWSPPSSWRSRLDPLGREIRAELSRYGPQAGMAELVELWPSAVGTAIARNAWPARIAKDGTVHVNTADSVWAFELEQRASEMAQRLGVPRLRFAPGPVPEGVVESAGLTAENSPGEAALARAINSSICVQKLRGSV